MVGYDEALAIAREYWDEVDHYQERENAFIFSKKNDRSIGGSSPVVVMKDSGDCIHMTAYITEGLSTRTIAEGDI